jgi:hypothetical protein
MIAAQPHAINKRALITASWQQPGRRAPTVGSAVRA